MTEAKHGFCKCGCGQKTNVWAQSSANKGVRKGDPRDYVSGHFQASAKQKVMSACHPDRVAKALGMCGSCYNAHLINRTAETRGAYLKAQTDRTKARKIRVGAEAWSAAQRNRVLRHRYGIDAERHDQMVKSQNNRCAICGVAGGETKSTKLYVDHNHLTGEVRELLCSGCNTAVGIVEQGIGRISELAAYLAKHDANNSAWNALARLDLMIRAQQARQAGNPEGWHACGNVGMEASDA